MDSPDNTQEHAENVPHEITDDIPAFLCAVNDNIEVAGIESLLRSYDIPVLIKWHGVSDAVMLYMAASSFGADIFVPSKLLDNAKGLLADDPLADRPDNLIDQNGNDGAEFAQTKRKQERTRRERALFMVFVLFILPVLLVLIMVVVRLVGLI